MFLSILISLSQVWISVTIEIYILSPLESLSLWWFLLLFKSLSLLWSLLPFQIWLCRSLSILRSLSLVISVTYELFVTFGYNILSNTIENLDLGHLLTNHFSDLLLRGICNFTPSHYSDLCHSWDLLEIFGQFWDRYHFWHLTTLVHYQQHPPRFIQTRKCCLMIR